MTKSELTDNLLYIAAMAMLENLAKQGLLSPDEAEQARRELDRQIQPTVILP